MTIGSLNRSGRVRIVVAGDHGTRKTSLINTVAAKKYSVNVPALSPPTVVPEDSYPGRVPITMIDTSSLPQHIGNVAKELKRADTVVLTYACDQPQTLDRLSSFWLPQIRQLEVKVPVIVVGCKHDLRDENQQFNLEQVMSPIKQQFPVIETYIECSALSYFQVREVFISGRKRMLYPTDPILDQQLQVMKPRFERALTRIFALFDRDRDGTLSDTELSNYQANWSNTHLLPSEIVEAKRLVQKYCPEGVNDQGLNLEGFLTLHSIIISSKCFPTTWTVLRKAGYNNALELADELLPISPLKRTPNQCVELTNEAIDFLKRMFDIFDKDRDEALRPYELEELFSTAPESPFSKAPYKDVVEQNAIGGLSLDGFLSQWALMTLLDPAFSMKNLIYIGYSGDISSAIRVTRKRCLDRKKQESKRNVYQCFVFGPKKAGKSALLDSFLGRPFSNTYNPTTEVRYAVNVVDQQGTKKTIVLKEIPEDGVKKFLLDKESLAACDVAVFVHDSSDESSWKRATKLLVEVSSHGEDTGFKVPFLIVAAKYDSVSFGLAIQHHSTRVSQYLGVEAPIPICAKLGDLNNVFYKIISTAEHPHLSIPKTEAVRTRKQYDRPSIATREHYDRLSIVFDSGLNGRIYLTEGLLC
ncbi:mitochondrial Rho GTPase 1 [Morus notabilis]|uniref:mitochondrial Rho GTPase 1 n=1 Tax=Morus notabilis TaxID=981085 RepID=UPI000CED5C8C|nr:mitochondrial Rho GTPase 1 [Morus notabilis]